jgi:hypothetical protein
MIAQGAYLGGAVIAASTILRKAYKKTIINTTTKIAVIL